MCIMPFTIVEVMNKSNLTIVISVKCCAFHYMYFLQFSSNLILSPCEHYKSIVELQSN